MLSSPRNRQGLEGASVRRNKFGKRVGQKRRFQLESLEDRTLLTLPYAFSYSSGVATALGTSDSSQSHSLVIEPLGGFLYYDVDDMGWSGNWGGSAVPLSPTLEVNVSISAGDGSSLTLGTPSGPAGALLGSIDVEAASNTGDTLVVDDSAGTTVASPAQPYSIDTDVGSRTISGPGFHVAEGSAAFEGGVTLKGSAMDGDTNNVLSVAANEPFNLIIGSAGSTTVAVGSGGTLDINAALAISSAGGRASVNINDQNDSAASTGTLDDLSGNTGTPYEVTGLSAAPIEYGASIAALSIGGGTDQGSGVMFDINDTQAGTTTTMSGGPDPNMFNLSDASEAGGLGNLLGPVVVAGGGAGDSIVLNDQGNHGHDSYILSDTVVRSSGAFGGLTYGGLGAGVLTLNADAPSKIAPAPNQDHALVNSAAAVATIDIDNTADSVTTVINAHGGFDTTTVHDTGSYLTITTGTSDGNTVNVLGNREPVSIDLGYSADIDAVNIGSTGGAGTMAGILAPIDIDDAAGSYALAFHDENDAISQTWTLNDDDAGDAAMVTRLLKENLPGEGTVTMEVEVNYTPSQLLPPLTIDGGSGGNTFIVNDTTGYATTDLNTGPGNDTVDVYASGAAGLDIDGQGGSDAVTLGALAGVGMQNLSGEIDVTNSLGVTALTLDDSGETLGETASLSDDGTTGTVTGLSPATVQYSDTAISSLTIKGGSGRNLLDDDCAGRGPGRQRGHAPRRGAHRHPRHGHRRCHR